MRLPSILILAAIAAAFPCPAQTTAAHSAPARHTKPVEATPAVPEIVFFNGTIFTGVGMAQDRPEVVEAMAVGGGKVLAVGSNEQVTRLAGPKTRLKDLSSAGVVFPGFNDAHTHLGGAGRTKLNLDLTGVRSQAEMTARIKTYAAQSAAGHWITGGNWDHTLWSDKTLPTKQDLDKVTGGHPAFLDRIDGHIAIANSAALAAAGITGKTAPPQGGAIDLDAKGEPTGILRESAQELVYKVVPPPSHEDRQRGAELAIEDAVSHGVTSVQDFSDWQDFLVFEELEKEGKLNVRISEWLPFKSPLPDLIRMRAHHDQNDPMLHTGMLKGFMDGSLGSRTAAMKEPFADDARNTGLAQFTQDQLNQMTADRAQAGFQIGFHAIGDKATSMALDAFTVAEEYRNLLSAPAGAAPCRPAGQPYKVWDEKIPCAKNGSLPNGAAGAPRFRIEHAQVVDPADIPRFKSLGVIASMQPNHLLTDMNWAEDRLGPKRAAYSYAWKAFLDAGVPLAFGTDYPVEPVTPFRGLYAAVTRMNEAGTKTYFPENKLTRGQALAVYTQGSAYAEFAEKRKGKLAPGYDADFIVVDRNLFSIAPKEILATQVLKTYVGGREVYAGSQHAQ
jgi:predicted amidohydrolase YtcJ